MFIVFHEKSHKDVCFKADLTLKWCLHSAAWQWHLSLHLRANVNDGAEVADVEANEAVQCRKTERGMFISNHCCCVFIFFFFTCWIFTTCYCYLLFAPGFVTYLHVHKPDNNPLALTGPAGEGQTLLGAYGKSVLRRGGGGGGGSSREGSDDVDKREVRGREEEQEQRARELQRAHEPQTVSSVSSPHYTSRTFHLIFTFSLCVRSTQWEPALRKSNKVSY